MVARGVDRWLDVAERAVGAAERGGAESADALVTADDSALTRFANSEIHQNVAESDANVSLRVVIGRRAAVASSGRLDAEGIRRLAEKAIELARLAEERDEPIALPEPGPIPDQPASFSEITAGATPELRAAAARAIIAAADAAGVASFGSVATETGAIAVASSRGIRAQQERTAARILTVSMQADGGSGYAEGSAVDVGALDAEAIGREAADRARRTGSPVPIEPGDYEVVLEPYAVADILGTLDYLGFSALAVQEGRSFLEAGRQVGSELVSIWDDGQDPAGLPMAFDFEGVAKRRVALIERGICGTPVYDAQTAARDERRSTGHGLPAPNPYGPLALNLFMAAGVTPAAELVGGMARGLLVTRFHYTNPVHPKLAVVTGMTRDGTFLVENGEIVAAVRNLRFTESYLDALRGVTAVSRERRLIAEGFAATLVPAIRVERFTFTGATEH